MTSPKNYAIIIFLIQKVLSMRRKTIALFTAFSFLIAGSVYANIHVTSSSQSRADACDQFVGSYDGEGRISSSLPWYLGGDLNCHYIGNGSGGVTVANTAGAYSVHVDVSSASDSDYRCPSSETIDLPASCNKGAISMQSDKANLHGNLHGDGSADLTGTLTFSALGSNIDANVDSLHLVKR
jgi:hypothetical protein